MKDLKITMAAARVNADLTQQQVADILNVSKVTVLNWERGYNKIPANRLAQFCEVVGVDVDNIFLPSK